VTGLAESVITTIFYMPYGLNEEESDAAISERSVVCSGRFRSLWKDFTQDNASCLLQKII
jgi:hypothetical protein